MIWTFDTPAVVAGDEHIDAACIKGDFSGGGFCCGIKYVGALSPQPEQWAKWFSNDEFDAFSKAVGFGDAVTDTDNWRSDDSSFTITWSINRWLPKEERSIDYYVYEYRFVSGEKVDTYAYKYTSDDQHIKTAAKTDVILLSGLSGISFAGAVLAAACTMLAF